MIIRKWQQNNIMLEKYYDEQNDKLTMQPTFVSHIVFVCIWRWLTSFMWWTSLQNFHKNKRDSSNAKYILWFS